MGLDKLSDFRRPGDESDSTAEFLSFDRLAGILISVPTDRMRKRIDDLKRRSATNPISTAVPAGDLNEEPTRTDPD